MAIELKLVNLIRDRVAAWREQGYPGITRTTNELLQWWRRDGREVRLFYAQLEAAETIIFLTISSPRQRALLSQKELKLLETPSGRLDV